MLVRFPDYYKSFKCTASKCSDNCCIGWEIDIDEKTLEYYQNADKKMGGHLLENIELDGETPNFILKNDRCPFLNDDNLCEIILNLGAEHLCDICRMHPRFNNWLGNERETGLGLCCEEAARLILSQKEKTLLLEETTDEPAATASPNLPILKKSREKLFEIVQNRNKSIGRRITEIIVFSEIFQAGIDLGKTAFDFDKMYAVTVEKTGKYNNMNCDFTEKLTDILSSFEYMQDELLKTTASAVKRILENGYDSLMEFSAEWTKNTELENILFYTFYRYYLKSADSMMILERVKAILFFIYTFVIMEYEKWCENKGRLTIEMSVHMAKLLSKEIEYSEDNLDMLENSVAEVSSEELICFVKKAGLY